MNYFKKLNSIVRKNFTALAIILIIAIFFVLLFFTDLSFLVGEEFRLSYDIFWTINGFSLAVFAIVVGLLSAELKNKDAKYKQFLKKRMTCIIFILFFSTALLFIFTFIFFVNVNYFYGKLLISLLISLLLYPILELLNLINIIIKNF